MKLHNKSGNITVIIDVSFEDKDMFLDFILNEQCQFIDSVDPEGLIKFEIKRENRFLWFCFVVLCGGSLTQIKN